MEDEKKTKVQLLSELAELHKRITELEDSVTNHKQFEERLKSAKELAEASNRSKSDFLANLSHEFRTPLNHIIGFTELIVDKHFGELNKTQEEYLNIVLESSRHLLSLMIDVMDLSKMEVDKLELEPSEINLKLFVENSMNMIKEKAMEHDIQLSTDIEGIPETITADHRKLKKILYNLLSNAVEFTPVGGSIRLSMNLINNSSLRADSDQEKPSEQTAPQKLIQASVVDTGIGIRQEDLEHIFEPFKQVNNPINRKHPGTGLSLSMTKKLVELHGGKIWVESEGEGKGCVFSFTIPV